MNKLIQNISIISLILSIIAGCSSTSETTEQKSDEDEVYVFDEAKSDSTFELTDPMQYPSLGVTYYVVQIGAFTTKERAENFMTASKSKINHSLNIAYSKEVNLYVVQLSTAYTSKTDAEKIRNDIWKMNEFKDAWILTVNK